jgi:hypothetical protein
VSVNATSPSRHENGTVEVKLRILRQYKKNLLIGMKIIRNSAIISGSFRSGHKLSRLRFGVQKSKRDVNLLSMRHCK